MPGLSLVEGKYIYVRGLGERYSSTYVNGTLLPSPEPLQRAVPLDLFDTSVAKNVLVQKTYSANYGLEFSGGVVDIRTAGIPDEAFFKLKLSSAYNDYSTGETGQTYTGGTRDWLGVDDGARDLPGVIRDNLGSYKNLVTTPGGLPGELGPEIEDAVTISFNNVWNVDQQSNPYDGAIELAGGNRFQINDSLNLGFVATASLSNQWRNRLRKETRYDYRELTAQSQGDVEAIFDNIDRIRADSLNEGEGTQGVLRVTDRNITQHSISRNLLLAIGAEFNDQHYIDYTVMQARKSLRNGLDRSAAVAEAVRIRARPIYLSTLTSIFGMLPLMVVPGVGSQIYRGLATVIIGGMLVSALFTLILMPSILRLPPLELPRALRRKQDAVPGVPADA